MSPWLSRVFIHYRPEFKETHAEREREAWSSIHGDHYSCVTTAAGRQHSRIVFITFYMCCNQGDHNKTDRMR